MHWTNSSSSSGCGSLEIVEVTISEQIAQIIADLNEKTGKRYKPSIHSTIRILTARLKDGYTFEEFQHVHEVKCEEWLGTEYSRFLRPATLYQDSKFEAYLNQDVEKEKVVVKHDIIRILWCYKCDGLTNHKWTSLKPEDQICLACGTSQAKDVTKTPQSGGKE